MLKIDIYTKDVELTPALQEYVNRKVGSLEKFSKNKVPFQVSVELDRTTHHHYKGYVFRAELQMQVPGGLLRSESVKEDLRMAIDEAKNELERELKQTKDKRKDLVKRGGRFLKSILNFYPLSRFQKKNEEDEDKEEE